MRLTYLKFLLFLITVSLTAVLCSSQIIHNEIVLINIGTLDRKGIADEILIIESLNPKVIAVDAKFSNGVEGKNIINSKYNVAE